MLNMEYYFEPTEDFLRQAYEVDGLSQKSIGKMCGMRQTDISKKLKEFGIDTNFTDWTDEKIREFCKNERPEYELVSGPEDGSKGIAYKYTFKYNGDFISSNYNRKFEVRLENFLYQGTGHPMLNASSGERKIYKKLSDAKYDFEKEFVFEDCIGKKDKKLRFDFAVFINDEDIKMIEYDGKQHFEPIECWGGDERLNITQNNDKIKDKYCKENNIDLLRIPYWDFDNIDVLIDDFIKV